MTEQTYLMPRPEPAAVAGFPGPALHVPPRPSGYNLRDHLSIIFKHKYKIVVLFVVALLAAPVVYFILPKLRPPMYQAKSVLMLKSGRDYTSPELGTERTPISFAKADIFTSEILMLKSRDLKERILSTIGLARVYPDIVNNPPPNIAPLEAAILRMDKELGVAEIRNSNFIEISFTARDPEMAARVVNQMVDFYKEKRREVLSDPKSTFFLEKKLAEYRQKLKDSEEKLETFRHDYGFYSFDKQMDFLLTQRAKLEGTIKDAQAEAETLKQTLTMLNNQPKMAPQVMPSYSTVDESPTESTAPKELASRLLLLQQKEQELLIKYTEKNYFVVSIRKQIEGVKELIKKAEKAETKATAQNPLNEANPLLQNLDDGKNMTEASVKAAEDKIAAYKQEFATLQKQIEALGSQEKKLNELNREHTHNEHYYQTYSNKLEEVRITEDINRQEMASVSVLQAAVPPARPVNLPFGLMTFLAAGALGGLGAGVGLAYVLEITGQGLTTPEAVENRLGLPVLATIPFKS